MGDKYKLYSFRSSWDHPVFAENLAEGATTPLLMAKQGHTKFVFSAVDPEQLFDLEQDPHEQTNQVADPDYQDAYQALSQLVRQQCKAGITDGRVAPAIIPDYTEEQVRERQLTANYVGNVR